MNKIAKLQYITQDVDGQTHQELAEAACRNGVDWVQLRIKNKPVNEIRLIAEETLAICKNYDAKLIINDHPEIAQAIHADGVHLGKSDMPPAEARKLLGDNFIIGGTANTTEDIRFLADSGVDYIGLGPFRFTQTKEQLSPVLELEGYEKIMHWCHNNEITVPIIAIGGITTADVQAIKNTGVHGVAIASAINHAQDKKAVIEKINAQLYINEMLKTNG